MKIRLVQLFLTFTLLSAFVANSFANDLSVESPCLTGDCMLCVLLQKEDAPIVREFVLANQLEVKAQKYGNIYRSNGLWVETILGEVLELSIDPREFTGLIPFELYKLNSPDELIQRFGEASISQKGKKQTLLWEGLKGFESVRLKAVYCLKTKEFELFEYAMIDTKWSHCQETDEFVHSMGTSHQEVESKTTKIESKEDKSENSSDFLPLRSANSDFQISLAKCLKALVENDPNTFKYKQGNDKWGFDQPVLPGSIGANRWTERVFGTEFREMRFTFMVAEQDPEGAQNIYKNCLIEIIDYFGEGYTMEPHTKTEIDVFTGEKVETGYTYIFCTDDDAYAKAHGTLKGKYLSAKVFLAMEPNAFVPGYYDVSVQLEYAEN